ncbi:hypothetical protein GCM10029978_067870 [Actinoallomurus acanthiterrae]
MAQNIFAARKPRRCPPALYGCAGSSAQAGRRQATGSWRSPARKETHMIRLVFPPFLSEADEDAFLDSIGMIYDGQLVERATGGVAG